MGCKTVGLSWVERDAERGRLMRDELVLGMGDLGEHTRGTTDHGRWGAKHVAGTPMLLLVVVVMSCPCLVRLCADI